MKKRHSPLRPPIEKKQREKKLAGLLRGTVYRGCTGACAGACAGATCAGARRGVAAVVAAVVEEALVAFDGTRGQKPSDEAIWAEIAWRVGAENFAHAVIEKKAEDAADGRPRRPAAAFQKFLNERFPRPEVRGQRSEVKQRRSEV